jgi:hypothetical protein
MCVCVSVQYFAKRITSENERDWDKDLADEVKGECEDKYGKVEAIKVDKDSSQVCWISFRYRICLSNDGL